MRNSIRVEKRLPFGFRGEWGRVYKQYLVDESESDITYQNHNYIQIDSDVQFKSLKDGFSRIGLPTPNVLMQEDNKVIETTDAYYEDEIKDFKCVVSPNDIVFVLGNYWTVESVHELCKYTPNKQSFFYIEIKKIYDYVVRS